MEMIRVAELPAEKAKRGRPKRKQYPVESSLVVGGWRLYPFSDNSWAIEPLKGSKATLERKREYHTELKSAILSLINKSLLASDTIDAFTILEKLEWLNREITIYAGWDCIKRERDSK